MTEKRDVTALTPNERPATREWGCDHRGCLRAARIVVTDADGVERGACSTHMNLIRREAIRV